MNWRTHADGFVAKKMRSTIVNERDLTKDSSAWKMRWQQPALKGKAPSRMLVVRNSNGRLARNGGEGKNKRGEPVKSAGGRRRRQPES